MAKKEKRGGARLGAGRPKTSERKDVVVKIDETIVAEAKHVVLARGITLAEYLSDLLRASVHRDFLKELKRLTEGEEPK